MCPGKSEGIPAFGFLRDGFGALFRAPCPCGGFFLPSFSSFLFLFYSLRIPVIFQSTALFKSGGYSGLQIRARLAMLSSSLHGYLTATSKRGCFC